MEADIRRKQRFQNFEQAFDQFQKAVELSGKLSDLEKEGTIQRFESTHELAWKVMKDFLEYEGISHITGSRSATREAFNKGLITNGNSWMKMIESRNKTVHTYMENILEQEYKNIVEEYFPLLKAFYNHMKTKI